MSRLEKEKWITMAALLGLVLLICAWGKIRPEKEETEVIQITAAASEESEEPKEPQLYKRVRYEQKTGKEEERRDDKTTICFETITQGDPETISETGDLHESGHIEAKEVSFEDKAAAPLHETETSGEICEVDDRPGEDGPQESAAPEVVPEVETTGMELPVVEDITSQETTTAPEETAAGAVAGPVLYSVNGAVLPEEIQAYLYEALAARGIQWFFPYAVMIAYQESRFNTVAENRNGLDKGLFQYRVTYWSYGDIFSPYDQINVFVQQMANRAAAGCTISDMISRHKQSDWGSYDQVYVDQVMQWEPVAVRIR